MKTFGAYSSNEYCHSNKYTEYGLSSQNPSDVFFNHYHKFQVIYVYLDNTLRSVKRNTIVK